jgi:hypothetical protein
MAQISIIDRINRRRIFTFGGLLLVVLVLGSILIMKNPRQGQAASHLTGCAGAGLVTIINSHMTYVKSGATVYDNPDTTNYDITLDNCPVTMSGTNYMKSLTLQNGAVMTHDAITASDINRSLPASDPGYLLSSGQAKLVDIRLSGNLTIQSGSSINVSGKGFPGGMVSEIGGLGGDGSIYGRGFGPGASNGFSSSAANIFGASASYGGLGGGWGTSVSGGPTSGVTYGDEYHPDQWGSGSGAVRNWDDGNPGSKNGVAGGGRIYIEANDIIMPSKTDVNDHSSGILANGSWAGAQSSTAVGAGSGGSIWIRIRNQDSTTIFKAIGGQTPYGTVAGGWGDRNTRYGAPGSMHFKGLEIGGDALLQDIRADGGGADGITPTGGSYTGGGGGRAVIELLNSAVSIKKSLLPVSRPTGATFNPVFNPYALQLGDVIKVDMLVSQITPPTTISDKFLTIGGGAFASGTVRCAPSDATGNIYNGTAPPVPPAVNAVANFPPGSAVPPPANPSINGNAISWSVSSGTSFEFWYYCTVTK